MTEHPERYFVAAGREFPIEGGEDHQLDDGSYAYDRALADATAYSREHGEDGFVDLRTRGENDG